MDRVKLPVPEAVKRFLSSGSGYGYGSGSGYGDGSGYGYGYGYGIKSINGSPLYNIDGVLTIITGIRTSTVAKGFTLRQFSFVPCYIVRTPDRACFAHGATLRQAMAALREKQFYDIPEADRIASFMDEHDDSARYSARDLWTWHGYLTGSCEFGRNEFAENNDIDLDADTFTVREFIKLTRNAYGGEVIRNLEKSWNEAHGDGEVGRAR